MKGVLVSIVVPVYRTPIPLLHRLVRSALGQTVQEIELVIVDDASPDECPSAIDALKATDNRVLVLHRRSNGRAGMARSDGFAVARGQYVLFADSDDMIQSDMCESLVCLAGKHGADIAACSWTIADEAGHLVGQGTLPDKVYNFDRPCIRDAAFRRMGYALWNKLFRRETILPLRFESFEANIGEDALFNVEAVLRSRRMITTSYVGYEYTVRGESATGRAAKGMPYLRTLALLRERVRAKLIASGYRAFADRMALGGFTTGCGWIAEHPDAQHRSELWAFWHRYLLENVLPNVKTCRSLATCCRLAAGTGDPARAYALSRLAMKLADPSVFLSKVRSRLCFINRAMSKDTAAT